MTITTITLTARQLFVAALLLFFGLMLAAANISGTQQGQQQSRPQPLIPNSTLPPNIESLNRLPNDPPMQLNQPPQYAPAMPLNPSMPSNVEQLNRLPGDYPTVPGWKK